eukprot:TRINITY_DN84842_c0_g1_i1.p1 TRINITY_DN84842_c0_g1~~TRINITY_DN84842_c0_g1_i1.p1  ORF type:complete len:187 (+),score=23.20 TRINITY_DN84842_c0_g1_i1:30-563(+)
MECSTADLGPQKQFADPECCWCAGLGIDAMTGEPCVDCCGSSFGQEAKSCRRRSRRSKGGLSLSGFLSDVNSTKPTQRKRRPKKAWLECTDEQDCRASDATSEIDAPNACRSSKVQFDLEAVLVFHVTPYSEVYGEHPSLLRHGREALTLHIDQELSQGTDGERNENDAVSQVRPLR